MPRDDDRSFGSDQTFEGNFDRNVSPLSVGGQATVMLVSHSMTGWKSSICRVIGSSRLRSLRTEDATISLKVTSVWIQAVARHQQVSWRLILGMDGPDSIAERGLQRSGLVRRDVGRLVTPAIGL